MSNIYSWRRNEAVESLDDLMIALYSTQWNVSGELRFDPRRDKQGHVFIYHDCNYYVDSKMYPVPAEVAKLAIDRGLVDGVKHWGYTSSFEWTISERGRDEARTIRKRWDEHEKNENMTVIEDHDLGDCG